MRAFWDEASARLAAGSKTSAPPREPGGASLTRSSPAWSPSRNARVWPPSEPGILPQRGSFLLTVGRTSLAGRGNRSRVLPASSRERWPGLIPRQPPPGGQVCIPCLTAATPKVRQPRRGLRWGIRAPFLGARRPGAGGEGRGSGRNRPSPQALLPKPPLRCATRRLTSPCTSSLVGLSGLLVWVCWFPLWFSVKFGVLFDK